MSARADLEALSFVMQVHDANTDDLLDYDVEEKCYRHSMTGEIVQDKVYKYLAKFREGLINSLMEATSNTAMLLDVTIEQGREESEIQAILELLENKSCVVRNS